MNVMDVVSTVLVFSSVCVCVCIYYVYLTPSGQRHS